jgi:hypothetical protein
LELLVRRYPTGQQKVIRARIVLLAAMGKNKVKIDVTRLIGDPVDGSIHIDETDFLSKETIWRGIEALLWLTWKSRELPGRSVSGYAEETNRILADCQVFPISALTRT